MLIGFFYSTGSLQTAFSIDFTGWITTFLEDLFNGYRYFGVWVLFGGVMASCGVKILRYSPFILIKNL